MFDQWAVFFITTRYLLISDKNTRARRTTLATFIKTVKFIILKHQMNKRCDGSVANSISGGKDSLNMNMNYDE